MRRSAWRSAALIGAGLIGAAGPAHAQSPPPSGLEASDQADAHARKGKELLTKRGDVPGARREYQAAWALKKTFDIAANLGSIELELGLPRDAAEHLAFSLRNYASTGTTPGQRERTRQRFEEAKRLVAAIAIDVGVEGAEVFVDGSSIGRSPLPEDVYVDPGTRVIEARLEGHATAKLTIEVSRGSSRTVSLTLAPIPVVLPEEPRRPEPSKTSVAPIVIGAGVAAAGTVVGVVGLVLMAVKGGDVNALAGQIAAIDKQTYGGTNSACSDPSQRTVCNALDGAYESRGSFRNLAISSFAVAGAAGIGAISYAVATGSKAPVRASFGVSPAGGGVLVSGSF